ncbi:hypothetical protein L6452_18047 [Arctium lappa]|uniref:Uncharacterized protein n=1 Tax=Arctium lappa TaxID=4217 RepID=A0ACB9C5A1_ARCLA|nr:hypothetical protein L6452_18047 [Arctium lappa]
MVSKFKTWSIRWRPFKERAAQSHSQPQQARNVAVDPSTTPTPATPVSLALPTYDRYCKVRANIKRKFDVDDDDDDSHDHQKGEKRQRTESVKPSCITSDIDVYPE